MNKSEIQTIIKTYGDAVGFDVKDKSRLMPVVMRKAAIMTALSQEGRMHDGEIAALFNHDRTTCLHHRRAHVGNYMVEYYRDCYNTATRIINNVSPRPTEAVRTISRSVIMHDQLNELRKFLDRGKILRYANYCEDITEYIKDLETQLLIQQNHEH